MLKKIFFNLVLSIALLNTGSMVVNAAYQIDSSFKPGNEPFALTDTINKQGSAGATITILQIIAGGLLYFAVPIGVIMIAWAGSTMVTMGSQQEKLEEAKKHLTWTIVGLVLIILSYSLVRIIINFLLTAGSFTPTP